MTHARYGIALAVAVAALAGVVFAQEEATPNDVRSLAAEFSKAWERGDAAAMAGLFTAEGDLVLATGLKAEGRAKIENALEAEIRGYMQGTHFRIAVDSAREVAKDVVFMDGSASLAGVKTPDGSVVRPLPHLVFAVAVNRDGKWMFEALRISVPVPTAPE
ncbi:MAG: SgcJ/EcaC family oxidoreductase [Vicinamibacteria bacterium]|nr:SgcJ/EcaC family oxidoreductase [Vicinamibacteria bacterium]